MRSRRPLGAFQNWVNNVPENDGIKPNENFARELMQLFTIGVNELNDDGTPKLDAQRAADRRPMRRPTSRRWRAC